MVYFLLNHGESWPNEDFLGVFVGCSGLQMLAHIACKPTDKALQRHPALSGLVKSIIA